MQRHLLSIGRHLTGRSSPPPSKTFTETFPTVSVFEWRPVGGAINFGDHLATVVANKVLADAGIMPGEQTDRAKRLFTVGSVLHFADTGDTVWGSGVNGKVPVEQHGFTGLDVRAVRGPRTAAFLRDRGIAVPDVFGDPALLLPTLFPGRFPRTSKMPALFVPNLHDVGLVEHDIAAVSPMIGWNRLVEQVVAADFVVASSLHGLVIAEAFGIPARYVRLTESENLFKYEDYVMGTGRDRLDFATSIDQALDMGGMPPIAFDPQRLLAAFPWDLWGR